MQKIQCNNLFFIFPAFVPLYCTMCKSLYWYNILPLFHFGTEVVLQNGSPSKKTKTSPVYLYIGGVNGPLSFFDGCIKTKCLIHQRYIIVNGLWNCYNWNFELSLTALQLWVGWNKVSVKKTHSMQLSMWWILRIRWNRMNGGRFLHLCGKVPFFFHKGSRAIRHRMKEWKFENKCKDIRTSSWIAFAPAWVPFPPSTKSISILLAYTNQ